MKAILNDRLDQTEELEVPDPPPHEVVRSQRIGDAGNAPGSLPDCAVEYVYRMHRSINGVMHYQFYSVRKKDG